MSSPRRTPRGTPSKQVTSPTPSGQSDSSRPQDMDVSEMSELAAPLPSSPAIPPSRGSELDLPRGGPGSVMVSEIDLSSPLNYGTPGSVGSSIKTPRTGVRGTPIRIRSDIQSDKRLRTVNLSQPEGDAVPSSAGDGLPQSEVVPPSEASETAPTMVIWGTDVSVVPCKAKFKKFVETWVDPEPDVDEMMSGMDKNAPTYMQRLEEIATLENPFLDVNCGHIQNFDADLYRQLICYPQEVIPTLDMAVNEMFFERFPDTTLTHQIQVRPYSADKTKNMRTLGPEDIDQLITITGMVTRASDLIPEMAEAVFRCSVCRYTVTAELERGRIHEPTLCQHCSTNHSFSLVHNRSRFSDKQMVKLQESPDDMPAGQTPHTVILYVHGELVDAVQPGDRVSVTGVYRAVPMRVSPIVRNIRSVYKTHIDVVHFRKTDATRLQGKEEKREWEPEKVAELEELSKKPDIYERLARALAPSIYENEDIKKGCVMTNMSGIKAIVSFARLYANHKFADIQVAIINFFQVKKVELNWNNTGSSVLLRIFTETDKTGSSYYGRQQRHHLFTKDDSAMVTLSNYRHQWSPSGREFMVVYYSGVLISRFETLSKSVPDPPLVCVETNPGPQCAVCFDPIVFPAILTCGHSGCWACICGALEHSPRCPSCSQVPIDFSLPIDNENDYPEDWHMFPRRPNGKLTYHEFMNLLHPNDASPVQNRNPPLPVVTPPPGQAGNRSPANTPSPVRRTRQVPVRYRNEDSDSGIRGGRGIRVGRGGGGTRGAETEQRGRGRGRGGRGRGRGTETATADGPDIESDGTGSQVRVSSTRRGDRGGRGIRGGRGGGGTRGAERETEQNPIGDDIENVSDDSVDQIVEPGSSQEGGTQNVFVEESDHQNGGNLFEVSSQPEDNQVFAISSLIPGTNLSHQEAIIEAYRKWMLQFPHETSSTVRKVKIVKSVRSLYPTAFPGSNAKQNSLYGEAVGRAIGRIKKQRKQKKNILRAASGISAPRCTELEGFVDEIIQMDAEREMAAAAASSAVSQDTVAPMASNMRLTAREREAASRTNLERSRGAEYLRTQSMQAGPSRRRNETNSMTDFIHQLPGISEARLQLEAAKEDRREERSMERRNQDELRERREDRRSLEHLAFIKSMFDKPQATSTTENTSSKMNIWVKMNREDATPSQNYYKQVIVVHLSGLKESLAIICDKHVDNVDGIVLVQSGSGSDESPDERIMVDLSILESDAKYSLRCVPRSRNANNVYIKMFKK